MIGELVMPGLLGLWIATCLVLIRRIDEAMELKAEIAWLHRNMVFRE